MQSLKKNWVLVPKMTWRICYASSGKSDNLHFGLLLLSKVYYVWGKSRIICHNTAEWCKLWKETDLCFEKWHNEFDEFWPSTWNSQNLYFNGVPLATLFNGVLYWPHYLMGVPLATLFNGVLWATLFNSWAKKVQRGYL